MRAECVGWVCLRLGGIPSRVRDNKDSDAGPKMKWRDGACELLNSPA